jgi:hypothetical protein
MLTLYLIWTDAESDDLIRVTVAMTVITGALAHANLLLGSRKRADDPASAILTATLVVSAILTSMIVIALLANADPDNGFWKLVAVLAVLLVLGTLVVPITRKIKDVGTLGYSEAAYSAPALLASSKAMEVRYQGRTIHVEVTAAEEQSGFRPHAWIVSGQDRRPLPLNGETSLATDAPTALAHAVRELARAVDSGQI